MASINSVQPGHGAESSRPLIARAALGPLTGASRQRVDTTLLMAVAALLVANSHLELFYPRAWLAGDGLIGNSLFFFLAGYGLARSESTRSRGFVSWMCRRTIRILPSLLIVMGVFAVLIDREWRSWHGVLAWVSECLWPTRFTFVQMVF